MILSKADKEILRSRAIICRELFRDFGTMNLIRSLLLMF